MNNFRELEMYLIYIGKIGGKIEMVEGGRGGGVVKKMKEDEIIEDVKKIRNYEKIKEKYIFKIKRKQIKFRKGIEVIGWDEKEVKQGEEGIVMKKGKDKIEEMELIMDLLWENKKKIVMKGEMRQKREKGDEGKENMVEEVLKVERRIRRERGVIVEMKDKIKEESWIKKYNEISVKKLVQQERGKLGYVYEEKKV